MVKRNWAYTRRRATVSFATRATRAWKQ